MTHDEVLILECSNQACGLRFTLPATHRHPKDCPRCHELLVLRRRIPQQHFLPTSVPHPNPLGMEALLDNIRSIFNVGSIFRSADGAGFDRLHLCGITPSPDNPKMSKTGLGAEWSVPWEYHPNALTCVSEKKQQGFKLVALECNTRSVSLFENPCPFPSYPVLLIVGNEMTGIDPDIQHMVDASIFIPMRGYKRSLNVCVAFGIAAVVWAQSRKVP
jgi:23S rRNA (guanosine2251-2'-O)-methyltransferase